MNAAESFAESTSGRVAFGSMLDLARLQVGTASAQTCDACNTISLQRISANAARTSCPRSMHPGVRAVRKTPAARYRAGRHHSGPGTRGGYFLPTFRSCSVRFWLLRGFSRLINESGLQGSPP